MNLSEHTYRMFSLQRCLVVLKVPLMSSSHSEVLPSLQKPVPHQYHYLQTTTAFEKAYLPQRIRLIIHRKRVRLLWYRRRWRRSQSGRQRIRVEVPSRRCGLASWRLNHNTICLITTTGLHLTSAVDLGFGVSSPFVQSFVSFDKGGVWGGSVSSGERRLFGGSRRMGCGGLRCCEVDWSEVEEYGFRLRGV